MSMAATATSALGVFDTGTIPHSNLRRMRRKGPIDSDDSQVQDRPSPGKPSLRYLPSTRIPNYSASTALVCWRRCARRSRSPNMATAKLLLRQEAHVRLVLRFCTYILRQPPPRSWTWLCYQKANSTQNSTIYRAYGNTANFSHESIIDHSVRHFSIEKNRAQIPKNARNHARSSPFPLKHVDSI